MAAGHVSVADVASDSSCMRQHREKWLCTSQLPLGLEQPKPSHP